MEGSNRLAINASRNSLVSIECCHSKCPTGTNILNLRSDLRGLNLVAVSVAAMSLVDRLCPGTYNQQRLALAGCNRYCPLVQRLGHLPLEQAIGGRIPGGQPTFFSRLLSRSSPTNLPIVVPHPLSSLFYFGDVST